MSYHDQHLPHTHRSPLESLKKRSLYIFSVLLALSVGYLAYSGSTSSPTGAVVATGGSVDEAGEFSISARLVPPLPEIHLTDATLTLALTGSGTLSFDGLEFGGVGERTLVLTGYTGTLSTSVNNGVSLEGKAASALLDTMSISKGGGSVIVHAADVPFSQIKMVGVTLDSVALVSTGTIDVANKGSFQVYDEPIELKPFTGSIDVDSKGLTLDGYIDKFRIEGARTISVE